MKKSVLLFVVMGIIISCNSPENMTEENNFPKNEFSTKKFVGNTVAYSKEGKVKLGVSEIELLKSFNNYSLENNLKLKADSFTIEKIDDKYYIRFSNDDDSISTVALISNNTSSKSTSTTKQMSVGETVCTTTACANCCGCVPNGNYCTHCDVNTLDCERTTSKPQEHLVPS